MTERETSQEPDEFYVPTPEELEQGIGPAARKRKKSRREETGGRGRITELARRLFRLRPGVGRERSEAPAPTTRPAVPDPSSPPPSAHPSSLREADDGPVPESSPAAPQPSEERQTRDQGTLPQPVGSTETPPSSPAKTKEQRLRRVTVPERTLRQPVKKPVAPSPVPDLVLDKASRKGHELSSFIEQRSFLAREHEQRYMAKCVKCESTAYAIRAADQNYTLKDTPWETQGPAFEKSCTG